MKKIMFNDRYGLTTAVLNGNKTMTRRIIPLTDSDSEYLDNAFDWDLRESVIIERYAQYKVGEIVAVAQSYKDIGFPSDTIQTGRCVRKGSHCSDWDENMIGKLGDWYIDQLAGWNNKMFVLADLMVSHIQMTALKIERLQDISNEDAMREGVFKYDNPPLFHEFDPYSPWPPHVKPYKHDCDNKKYFCEARFAFAHLIERVSRIGMWNINPWVLAYSFERTD